ncbi:MAG TPA: RsmB/NOP family class I SAM-dependent RNA methyltransferase [Gallionella sp.]|nr:RsmB/NOP family class I SAM-dependent RNA methyltransferase [Gallionella sp.]
MLITEYRLEIVIQALRAILPLAHPADTTLRYFFKDERIGSNERELVAETVFGVLRHRMLLEYACLGEAPREKLPMQQTFSGSGDGAALPAPDASQHRVQVATPRRMALAHMIRFGGYNLRELEPVLKPGEKDWLATVKAVKIEHLPLPVQAELPEWLVEKMRASYSDDDILAIGKSMQQGAPLDIRVNTLLAKREDVLQQLHEKNIAATATPWSPIGIRLGEKIPLNRDPLFTEGKIEVQDEGSQLLGFLLAPKRNDMVVDFCAGAGGKTLMLSAMMNSQGRLYAMDVSEKRLANLKPRLKRSGASNIQPMLIAHENDLKVKRLAGKIDRVLVDAPCSGLGTLRRSPDLKFRQSPGSIEAYTLQQAAILASASRLLKKGGRLVYATCSFLPEENQHIVQSFLAAHPDFVLLPANEILQQQKIALEAVDYLQLLPHIHNTDGFFAAVIERI